MIIGLLVLIITVATTAILGAVVYLRNPKSATSRSFLLYSVSAIIWATANYVVDAVSSLNASLLATRVTMAAGFSAFFWLYIFSRSLSSRPIGRQLPKYSVVGAWIIGLIFSGSPLVAETVQPGNGVININFGQLYVGYIAIMVGLVIVTLWQLRLVSMRGTSLEKAQVRIIAWGIGLSVGLLVIINGFGPFFLNDLYLVRISPILTLSLTGAMSYAIIKHRLFDIHLVVARLAAYILVVSTLGLIYGLVVFQLIDQLFGTSATQVQQVAYTLSAVFLAFTFQPLKLFFDEISDRLFYRSRYDSAALLTNIAKDISETLEMNKMAQKFLDELAKALRINNAAIVVVDRDQPIALKGSGFGDDNHKINSADVKSIKDLVVLEDKRNHPELTARGVELVVHFANKEQLEGWIILGEKQSGDIYTNQDTEVLQVLGPELAIALGNAQSYEQLGQFNQTLKEEVARATSNLREVNEQLNRKNQQLRQLDRLKDEFISVTSHELRTPLTAIRGYLWMAMRGKGTKVQYDEYLNRAYASAERLINLVNDTLDISRIESGRIQLAPTPVNIPALAKEVVDELASKVAEKQQDLKIDTVGNPPAAWCDENKVQQVLVNLIGNGLKYTPEKGHVIVTISQQEDHILVAIKDDGPGVAAKDQDRLFQKFIRLDATASIPGTGLGLFLCKQIVEMSGGKIWMESQEGKGATFSFTLPISQDQPSVNNHSGKKFRPPATLS